METIFFYAILKAFILVFLHSEGLRRNRRCYEKTAAGIKNSAIYRKYLCYYLADVSLLIFLVVSLFILVESLFIILVEVFLPTVESPAILSVCSFKISVLSVTLTAAFSFIPGLKSPCHNFISITKQNIAAKERKTVSVYFLGLPSSKCCLLIEVVLESAKIKTNVTNKK